MLLGARQSLWRSGRLSAKSYVQEGLVLQLDGIENAGYGVHDPNAKAWKDLKGFATSSQIINADVRDNGVEFYNKKRSRVICESSALEKIERTVEMCFKEESILSYPESGFLQLGYCHISAYRYSDGRTVSLAFRIYPEIGNSKFPIPEDFTGTISVDMMKSPMVFENGVSIIPTGTDTWGASDSKIIIGSRSSVGQSSCNATIYSVRIYNRILNNDERSQNYVIDKERFGI